MADNTQQAKSIVTNCCILLKSNSNHTIKQSLSTFQDVSNDTTLYIIVTAMLGGCNYFAVQVHYFIQQHNAISGHNTFHC